VSRRRTRVPEPALAANPLGLTILGLHAGDRVRFRGRAAGRWQDGVVARRERDGSVGLTDGKGAARAIPVERIEVTCTGPRGGSGWEPLAVRAARTEQLRLI
jgi:hypothetical protein